MPKSLIPGVDIAPKLNELLHVTARARGARPDNSKCRRRGEQKTLHKRPPAELRYLPGEPPAPIAAPVDEAPPLDDPDAPPALCATHRELLLSIRVRIVMTNFMATSKVNQQVSLKV